MGSIERLVASVVNTPPDYDQDEAVINSAVIAAADPVQLTAAVYRLTGTLAFPRLIADFALARKSRQMDLANSLAAKIMWDVEDEVLAQCRREVCARREP